MNEAIEKNRRYSDSYVQKINLKGNLERYPKKVLEREKITTIIDLGCGEGFNIYHINRLFPEKKITGIDVSQRRIDSLQKKFPQHTFICGDACNTQLKQQAFDLVISTQVIEHVPDDTALISETHRLLKPQGFAYITSVVKKPRAVYKYRHKGTFVLDPTHEREYISKDAYLSLFKDKFEILAWELRPVRRIFLGIKVRIPGYYTINALLRKK